MRWPRAWRVRGTAPSGPHVGGRDADTPYIAEDGILRTRFLCIVCHDAPSALRYQAAYQLPAVRQNSSWFRVSARIFFRPLSHATLPLRVLAAGESTSADPHGLSSACPVAAGVPASVCAGFELRTADGVWHAASASIPHDSGALLGRGVAPTTAIDLVATVQSSRNGLAPVVRASRFGFGPWPINTVVTIGDVPLFPWGEQPVGPELERHGPR